MARLLAETLLARPRFDVLSCLAYFCIFASAKNGSEASCSCVSWLYRTHGNTARFGASVATH